MYGGLKMTRDEFIAKAQQVHNGEGIDYSKVEYKNNRTKVLLIDPVYGEYWQTPSNHLKGHCHPRRRRDKISVSKRFSVDDIIRRFKEVHVEENLDYSKVEYVNMHTKVCIIDPDYGEYWQEPSVHLKGCVHPRRAIDKNANKLKYTTEIFKKLCKEVHPSYILDEVDYKSSQEKVCVICPKHGRFEAYPDALLQGKGCPKCGNHLSRGEDEIYDRLCTVLGRDNVLKNDRKVLGGTELDIVIPSRSIAIEYDGLRWHSEKFGKDRYYHLNKLNECLKNDIKLIHVFEDEWLGNKELVFEKILRIIGVCDTVNKIDGRKTKIVEIDSYQAKEFLNAYHIQGYARSTVYLGCVYGEELIGVMSFKKLGSDSWELNRFATMSKTLCRGCGGKLFSYFVKSYHPSVVKSFADKRWTMDKKANVYTAIGFKLVGDLKPDYRYTNGHGRRIHKFNFRKQKLQKKYNFDSSMTELEMAKSLGYDRIWDCGLFKYVWRKDDGR